MLESLFNKVADLQVFSCKIYEIFRNTFFGEHLRMTASINDFVWRNQELTEVISNRQDLQCRFNLERPEYWDYVITAKKGCL